MQIDQNQSVTASDADSAVAECVAPQTSDAVSTYTIGRLARAAGVGVETIRYYQRRELLPVPQTPSGFRAYPAGLVERIRFIKRAQELGFSLEEVATLLQLEDTDDRVAIRQVAKDRLVQVEGKLADLQKMQSMLSQLIQECSGTEPEKTCPIIHALNR